MLHSLKKETKRNLLSAVNVNLRKPLKGFKALQELKQCIGFDAWTAA